MLEALESGVKGGRWYSLIDKVTRDTNLDAAWRQVKRNEGAPGVDHVTISAFERRQEDELATLAEELKSGSYEPQAIRRVFIPKPGRPGEERPLGIPTVRDRVAQAATRNVLEPIFEVGFAEHSYGFRPKRGAKDALRHVRRAINDGFVHVVDADLKGYFDSIPHDRLMELVEQRVSDQKVLRVVDQWLHQRIMEEAATWTPTKGSPQGAVISPLLANIYLDPLDHLVKNAGFEMVRYADDFVILCRSRADAQAAFELVAEWVTQAGLLLHPDKTRLVDLSAGETFDFLGYEFHVDKQWLSKRSMQRFREKVRTLTPRHAGRSLSAVITDLNRVLKGWYGYFKHINGWMLGRLDAWIRVRLRAILYRYRRWKTHPKGQRANTWPRSFFKREGLFSLADAHRAEITRLRISLQPALR
jgi:RNA-directed DNA polymerase